MTILSFQFSIFNLKQKGFTLIEIMVSIGILGVLGTLSIVGFLNFNQSQALQVSGSEVTTILNLARSRAQSQIKPSSLCSGSNTLDGYSLKIISDKNYSLYLRCSGLDVKIDEENKNLPSDLQFTSTIPATFFFPVQVGEIGPQRQIIISNSLGKTKTITVKALE